VDSESQVPEGSLCRYPRLASACWISRYRSGVGACWFDRLARCAVLPFFDFDLADVFPFADLWDDELALECDAGFVDLCAAPLVDLA